MVKETKLQQMKRRLSLEKLDKDEKKDMFNKLTKAGGQVVDLDPEELNKSSQPSSSSSNSRKSHAFYGEPDEEQDTRSKKNVSSSVGTSKIEKESSKNPSFFTVFSYRLNCYFSWICNFSATKFRKRYINLVNYDLRTAMENLHALLTPIYKGNPVHSKEFLNKMYLLDNIKEYELGWFCYQIFDELLFTKIQKNMLHGVDSTLDPLKELFSKFYFFRAHATHGRIATFNILSSYAQMFPADMPQSLPISKAEKALFIIWEEFFVETRSLMLYYWVKHCAVSQRMVNFDDFIGIPPGLPPVGALAEKIEAKFLAKKFLDEEEKSDSGIKSEASKEVVENTVFEFPSKDIEVGINFILEKVGFLKFYEHVKTGADLRSLFTLEEKTFYAYALLEYFDVEFSFLWSGQQIVFYVLSEASGARYDPKKDLIQLNAKINLVYEQINEYLRQYKSYVDFLKGNSTGASKLVQKENKEKELTHRSYIVCQSLLKLFEEYSIHLGRILRSKETTDSLIGNWDEDDLVANKTSLCFVRHLTVFDALSYTYRMTVAAVWLLNKSDLSGKGHKLTDPKIIPSHSYEAAVQKPQK